MTTESSKAFSSHSMRIPVQMKGFIQGGLAAMVAGAGTHPIDLIKVRMQIQGNSAGGPLSVMAGILRNEGVFGLTRGLSASLLRQGVYSSTRFGVYDIGKQYLTNNGESPLPLHYKVINGLVSGAIGAAVGSPADLAMVRMQADGRLPLAQRRNYKNVGDALIRVTREEGVLALWRGCGPTVQRAMIVTAGQLASYDQAKEAFVHYAHMSEDSVGTHISASLTAGVVASIASNPVDLIKTRLMNMKANADGQMPYRGMLDCAVKTVQSEGVLALQKGLGPTMLRQCPYVVIMFICQEQIKKVLSAY